MKSYSGHLQRRLGLSSAISITVGAVIGSGIFLKPLVIAQSLPSVNWIFTLWFALGIVCLCGAFAYAELGAMFPEAGGQYVFLREAWGEEAGFLYGWVFFWGINSGTMAALATAFADYLLPLFRLNPAQTEAHSFLPSLVASAMILFLALINHFGVIFGAALQNLSTFSKLGALGLIVTGGLLASAGDTHTVISSASQSADLSISGVLTAFIGIFWAYEGWYQLPFNSQELKRPERNLPMGLIAGMLLIIGIYLAINAIYLAWVPFLEMRGLPTDASQQVPYLTVARIFSPQIANYLTLLVAISILGAANPNMLSSTRAFYAMAEDGQVPHALNWVHPKYGTPTIAIWTQALWSVFIVLYLQKFHDITAFVVFDSFLFYGLTVAAVYRLRFTRPNHDRPYRCSGYPITPALFILVSIGFIVALLLNPDERRHALVGLVILTTGIPYYYWREGRKK